MSSLLAAIVHFVERTAAIARTGLAFSPHGFDAERYEELLREAAAMRAALDGAEPGAVREIERRWRAEVREGYDGYVTAASGCGVIAFNARDEVLMIRRTNGRWWYPTGFCEVGTSLAENAAKEALEETGLAVRPLSLMAVIDSRKAGSVHRHIYSHLFYCRLEGGELRPNPLEALEAGFFALERLPEPLHGVDRKWIALAREFHFDGRRETYFDPLE
ncbi:MAG TPA: NUDIX hydrolase N-terminal domain-containing protein [Candidatus Binataceae bacterium]|nr:NUDIX hydrolase N-terminal domain-containing protein [Candidatus Binataceae bacterium]